MEFAVEAQKLLGIVSKVLWVNFITGERRWLY